MKPLLPALFITTLAAASAQAQSYNAIHGSAYFGSLNVYNNPAGMHNNPFKWDITGVAVQAKGVSNAVLINNFSLLGNYSNATAKLSEGYFARRAHATADVHLLNARYAFAPNQAIGFGINLRNQVHLSTSSYNYNANVKTGNDFFNINRATTSLNANFTTSSWLEIYGSYSRTLWESEAARLSGGVSLKLLRGLSAYYARLRNITFRAEDPLNDFIITGGKAEYGYSINYDRTGGGQTAKENFKSFMKPARSFVGLDLGVEYMTWGNDYDGPISYAAEESDAQGYDMKIGIALLDIGKNNFTYGVESRKLEGVTDKLGDELLTGPFPAVGTVDAFNDSVRRYIVNVEEPSGTFGIALPTRLVVNVDKRVVKDVYVNGELSLNLFTTSGDRALATRELNLLTVTPRWEKRLLGIYLPVQYTTEGQLWVGAALRVGPLLAGIHNLRNMNMNNQSPNGGAYVALTFREPQKREKKEKRERGGRRGRLGCPSF
jgi:hypothetical protein